MRGLNGKHSIERRWTERKMETQPQLKSEPTNNKEVNHSPDDMHVFRCPNPECGKVHFSVVHSAIAGAHFKPSCPSCSKGDHMLYYLVYASGGKMLLRADCGICRKSHSLFFPGIRRICERCGWEGEFFLIFQKSTF